MKFSFEYSLKRFLYLNFIKKTICFLYIVYYLYKTVDLLLFLFVKIIAWLKRRIAQKDIFIDIFNTKNCFRILKEEI